MKENQVGNLVDAEAWLIDKAISLVKESIYTRPEDGRLMHLLSPVDRGHYQAMFLRDFVDKVMVLPHLFADPSTAQTFDLFFELMSADHVPPEYIHCDGRVEYWCYGPGPLTDTVASLTLGVLAYHRVSGDDDYLISHISDLIQAIEAIPRHPISGLIWINPLSPHSPYGYTDTIQKTGEELISSVFLFDACMQLAAVLQSLNMGADSLRMTALAEKIQLGLEGLYDPQSGLYFAASYHCRQPDVWGSALAACTGAAADRSDDVARVLVSNYDKMVWRGHVRHLPVPMLWEKRLSEAREYRRDFLDSQFYARGQSTRFLADREEPNTYQNGAYWAQPIGWFVKALTRVDRALAERTLTDAITFFQEDGIWECVHPSGYRVEKDYTTSAVMPLIGFQALRQEER